MLRWCKEIGLWALDRGRDSCRHKTKFCELYCYNIPLYQWQKDMVQRDKANEEFWSELTGEKLYNILSRKKNPVTRMRLCTRGEAFSVVKDVFKVEDLLRTNHDVLFWIPTRGWRDIAIRSAIEERIFPLPNSRLMASVDPSNSASEVQRLQDNGWSTVRIGAPVEKRHLCMKTYQHWPGYCGDKCEKGCFSEKRVDVHLRLHWGSGTPTYKDWQTETFEGFIQP